ncbi:Protein F52H2.6 [Aphelenchoides avenae]|nr:Protein F52H2.6 [Aphelenchus avenae]
MTASDLATAVTKDKQVPLLERVLEYVLCRFRWIVVISFVLPVSVLYNAYFEFRNWLVHALRSAPKAHDRKVYAIQKQVPAFF